MCSKFAKVEEFGQGSRLGGLARSAMTVSYSMMGSILFFIIILLADGFVMGFPRIINNFVGKLTS